MLFRSMRQRVALIRTIATKPNLVLLDEPFSALDYQTRLRVSDDVYNILKEEGITAIMVTHDIGEAASISSKVIVMSKRPSKIKNVYLMDYQDVLKPLERRKSPLFNLYYDKLWREDRKSTRLNSSHVDISYAVFCLKKKKTTQIQQVTKTDNTIRVRQARQ